MSKIKEKANWKPRWTITRFASQEDKEKGSHYDISKIDGNVLTNAGINRMWELIAGADEEDFADAAVLAVGTNGDSVAEAATNTEASFTGIVKEAMEGGYPTFGSDQKMTWKASFDGDTANISWQEFGVLTKTTSGVLLNRVLSDEGSKTEGQVWDLELSVTLS